MHYSRADDRSGRAEQKSPSCPLFVFPIKRVTSAYLFVRSCRQAALKETRAHASSARCLRSPGTQRSQHGLRRACLHPVAPIQLPLFTENSSVNGRPSFGCRGWRTLSATLSLWLLLFGWASYLLGAHAGPTYPENIQGCCHSVVTCNHTLLLNPIWGHQSQFIRTFFQAHKGIQWYVKAV